MFLATEGLYAEVLRQPALVDDLLNRSRVVVAGPTTLAAIVSSLRMGFQTLAIEQRAAEVWKVLGAVKTEFGKFGGVLDKVKRQLSTASRTLDETGARTRAMERRLRSVEHLPEGEASKILELPPTSEEAETEEPVMGAMADEDEISG
jgi:DNA recombination protein RmuC